MSSPRAVRYRRLALAEDDKTKADLLLTLADECDRGVLCTADRWLSRKDQQPPKSEEFKAWGADGGSDCIPPRDFQGPSCCSPGGPH